MKILPILTIFLSLSAIAADAIIHKTSTKPTGWWYKTSVSESQINKFTRDNKARLVDIERRGNNSYSAVFVKNSGSQKVSGWWWKFGTLRFIKDELKKNKARLIDLEVYRDGNKTKYIAIMVRNSGAHKKAWWWYVGKSFDELKSKLKEKKARLIDLESYKIGSKRVFAAVMVRNTGADRKAWWWSTNRTFDQVRNLIRSKKAKLVDINPRGAGRYDVVLYKRDGKGWWWGAARTLDQVKETLAQNKARLVDLESIVQNGRRRFHFIAVDNANALERRVRALAANQAPGARRGFYLRQVGGSTLASVRARDTFVPASSIKALYHFAALNRVGNGQMNLTSSNRTLCGPDTTTNAPVMPGTNSCPFSINRCEVNTTTVSLQTLLTRMMVNSNNRHTQRVRELIGQANINNMARRLNMTDTLIRERIGCGPNVCLNSRGQERSCGNGQRVDNGYRGTPLRGSRTTLRDFGRLYEAAINTNLLGNQRDNFFNFMLNDANRNWIRNIATQEGNSLGISGSSLQTFRSNLEYAWKGGSYTNSNTSHYVRAGIVQIPFRVRGRTVTRNYVWGVFTDAGPGSATNNVANIATELLRQKIRQGLESFR